MCTNTLPVTHKEPLVVRTVVVADASDEPTTEVAVVFVSGEVPEGDAVGNVDGKTAEEDHLKEDDDAADTGAEVEDDMTGKDGGGASEEGDHLNDVGAGGNAPVGMEDGGRSEVEDVKSDDATESVMP